MTGDIDPSLVVVDIATQLYLPGYKEYGEREGAVQDCVRIAEEIVTAAGLETLPAKYRNLVKEHEVALTKIARYESRFGLPLKDG